jgi:predicted ATPase
VEVLFSFTSMCQRLGVEPLAYLQDALRRLPTMLAEQLADLLPDHWQAARQVNTAIAPPPVADIRPSPAESVS